MLIIAPTRELAMQSQEVLEEASNIVKIRRNTQLSQNLKIVLVITKFEFYVIQFIIIFKGAWKEHFFGLKNIFYINF